MIQSLSVPDISLSLRETGPCATCPVGKFLNHWPWKHSKNVWMWPLGSLKLWFRSALGSAGLMVALHDLRRIFQV